MTRRSAGRLALGLAMLLQGCAGLIQQKEPATVPAEMPRGEGSFEVFKGRPGIVIGAPPGSSDKDTDIIARDLARLTGWGLVVATGHFNLEAAGRGSDGAPARAEEAGRVYEAYQRRVAEAAQGPLRLYVEVRGDRRQESAERLEIATVGFGRDDAWRLKTLFELIRESRVDDPSVPRFEIMVESLDTVRYAAGGSGRAGMLAVAPRALDIELPRAARTTYRQIYTELLGALLNESTSLLVPLER